MIKTLENSCTLTLSLSLSMCFLMLTAFLMRWYRSSGRSGAMPFFFRILRILFPVTKRTWATPWESRRITPICDGVNPFFANFIICSSTSSDVNLSHVGTDLRYGRADWEIPFPGLCIRPMMAAQNALDTGTLKNSTSVQKLCLEGLAFEDKP